MLLISIGMSVVFLAVIWFAALDSTRSGYVAAACISLAGMAFGLCIGGPVMLLVALLVGIVAIACAVLQVRRRAFYLGSLAAVIVAYSIVIGFVVIPEQREWAVLEETYPIESLEGRLPEVRHIKQVDSGSARSAGSSQRLDAFEASIDHDVWSTHMREVGLRRLHSSSVARFIQSPGFGAARMIHARPAGVQINEPDPIPMPVYNNPSDGDTSGHQDSSAAKPINGVSRPEDTHESSLTSFFDPRTFGYVEDFRHVRGFQAHAFHYAPDAPRTWHIDKLELVSLLKHEEPAVYLSEHLPRMSELRDAPTRPLDDFEKQALAALQKGEDIQVQSGPNQIRMLGSIRAVKQCLKCHDVERGDLLGAFTYDLRNGR